eukprot:3346668-Rhodomonas_salina.1
MAVTLRRVNTLLDGGQLTRCGKLMRDARCTQTLLLLRAFLLCPDPEFGVTRSAHTAYAIPHSRRHWIESDGGLVGAG